MLLLLLESQSSASPPPSCSASALALLFRLISIRFFVYSGFAPTLYMGQFLHPFPGQLLQRMPRFVLMSNGAAIRTCPPTSMGAPDVGRPSAWLTSLA